MYTDLYPLRKNFFLTNIFTLKKTVCPLFSEGVRSCSIDGMGDFRDNHGDQSTLQNHMSFASAPGEGHPSTESLWFNTGNMTTSSQLQGFNVIPASTTCNIDTTVTILGGHVEVSSLISLQLVHCVLF